MSEYRLSVNGFAINATFREETVTGVLLPLLGKLTAMQRTKGGRLIVFLAAPPAAGKSTLAALLELLSLRWETIEPLQAVGIDGFHYHQHYILAHTVRRGSIKVPMRDVKGCPESYDVEKLLAAVRALRERDVKWPFYDRRLHDVVEDAVAITRKIVLIEGNWLLLKDGPWAALRGLCDYSIQLIADESALRDRLIRRKIMGGLSADEAARFYEASDGPNVARCLRDSAAADMALDLGMEGGGPG